MSFKTIKKSRLTQKFAYYIRKLIQRNFTTYIFIYNIQYLAY